MVLHQIHRMVDHMVLPQSCPLSESVALLVWTDDAADRTGVTLNPGARGRGSRGVVELREIKV